MKLFPAEINLNEFEIEEVSINFKGKKSEIKKLDLTPENIDFNFNVRKKRAKNEYKINFSLDIEMQKLLSITVRGFATYEFPGGFQREKIDAYLFGNVIPSIYITLRGILLMLTYNSPKRIVLPVVNFFKSYKENKES